MQRKTRSLEEIAQPHPLDRPARDQQPEAEERHAQDHADHRDRPFVDGTIQSRKTEAISFEGRNMTKSCSAIGFIQDGLNKIIQRSQFEKHCQCDMPFLTSRRLLTETD